MRLPAYAHGRTRPQRAALWVTRHAGAELDDVAKVAMRRPELFGRPFLALVHELLRGESAWTVGERELFAAVVSQANECQFCVGTHGEIARLALGLPVDDDWRGGAHGVHATTTANLLEALTRDPGSTPVAELEAARRAGVDDAALVEAFHIAYAFNIVNRVAHALDFHHPTDRARLRGARILRRNGYRLPGWLLR